MSKRRPQCGKHHKRRKSWHRGRGEARRWERAMRQMVAAERGAA